MFDLGWSELLVIGIVALIVVGPKDLPGMFRTVGQFVGKAKGMAREFSRAMNDAADQAGVNEMTDTLKSASNPMSSAMDEVKKATSFTEQTRASGRPKGETADMTPERRAQAESTREKAAEASPAAAGTESPVDSAPAPAASTRGSSGGETT